MAEPAGLGMSLDDLISKQQHDQGGGYGKQRRGRGGGGGGGSDRGPQRQGRGGRPGGRGGGGGGYERMEEDWQQQPRRQQQQQAPYGRHQGQYGGGGQQGGFGGQQFGGGQQQGQYGQGGRYPQRDPNEYRDHQRCFQADNGDYIFRFRATDLVHIDAAGNITLSSGGYHNSVTLASLNDALNLIGIRVTCPSGDVSSGDWSISDGRTLTRFADGVVLPAKGQQHAARGRTMLQAFNNPHHAKQVAAAAASNAAATAAGILPFTGFVPPGVPSNRAPMVVHAAGNGAARSGVFARLGGKQQQADHAPRFAPY